MMKGKKRFNELQKPMPDTQKNRVEAIEPSGQLWCKMGNGELAAACILFATIKFFAPSEIFDLLP
jgi:hypothetical protein